MHHRSAPKRKDELMWCTCCLLYLHCGVWQPDAKYCMPMSIGSFSYTRSGLVSLARSQFVGHRHDSEWPTERKRWCRSAPKRKSGMHLDAISTCQCALARLVYTRSRLVSRREIPVRRSHKIGRLAHFGPPSTNGALFKCLNLPKYCCWPCPSLYDHSVHILWWLLPGDNTPLSQSSNHHKLVSWTWNQVNLTVSSLDSDSH